ncbi:MAG: hypothetical protein ACI4I2_07730 [Oscillospiraceae bacterium]
MINKDFSLSEYNDFIKNISDHYNIYIWGAGNYGDIIGRHLSINNIKWCGYIDKNPSKHGKSLNDKTIYDFQTVLDRTDISELFILVSVSPLPYKSEQDNIKSVLENAGLNEKNYYFISHNLELVDNILYIVKNVGNYTKRSRELKGIYSGKRAFVIGNGPSLNTNDLNKLQNEISFGCNIITQMYDHVDWRLTDYFFVDPLFISELLKSKEDLDKLSREHKRVFTTFQSKIFDEYKNEYDNFYYLRIKRNMDFLFSEDITDFIGGGGTSLYEIFQIAIYMGIKEFYLLGVDYSFKKEMRADGKIIINENIQNHAKEIYQGDGVYYVDDIMKAWLKIKAYADAHDIKIFNATRGGKLEVFSRVDFDSLF